MVVTFTHIVEPIYLYTAIYKKIIYITKFMHAQSKYPCTKACTS